jgi:hypothetical protein
MYGGILERIYEGTARMFDRALLTPVKNEFCRKIISEAVKDKCGIIFNSNSSENSKLKIEKEENLEKEEDL